MKLLHNLLFRPVMAVDTAEIGLGWTIPSIGDLLTFLIRLFFIISGLAALLFLLMGALAWITSGGNKESVDKAREKIQQAVIGVVLIVAVLVIVVLIEKVVFNGKFCFGISCPIDFNSLKLVK